jgi:hypothetical protein
LAAEVRDIELRRLFEPTAAELRAERAGKIYIYEGLKESDVARALDTQFDRVEAMMFIRIQRPVPAAAPSPPGENPDTQPSYTQNDGC